VNFRAGFGAAILQAPKAKLLIINCLNVYQERVVGGGKRAIGDAWARFK
jgi:hypothetical protein